MASIPRTDTDNIERLRAELGACREDAAPADALDDVLTRGYGLVLALEGERRAVRSRVEDLAQREALDGAGEQELTRLVRREMRLAREELELRELLALARSQRRRGAAA